MTGHLCAFVLMDCIDPLLSMVGLVVVTTHTTLIREQTEDYERSKSPKKTTYKQVTRFTGSKHVASNNTLGMPSSDRQFRTYCITLSSLSFSPVFYARKYLLQRSSAGLLSDAVSF